MECYKGLITAPFGYKATQEMSVYLGCVDRDEFSWAMEFAHQPVTLRC